MNFVFQFIKNTNWRFGYTDSGGFKDKVISLFKTNSPKQMVYGKGKKLNKLKSQKRSQESIINSIRNLFKQEKINQR